MNFFETRVKILAESTDKNFSIVLKLLREHVSFGNLSFETLKDYKKILSWHSANLENLKIDRSTFKWPHQNVYECIAGYLFFPIQIERREIGAENLNFVQLLLATSASYSNTLAQYRLLEIFDIYSDSGENDKFKRFFPQDFEYFERYSSSYVEGVPCLFGSMLSLYAGYPNLMTIYLAKGVEKKIPQCIVHYAVHLKDKTRMLDLLKQIGDKKSYIDLARFNEKDKTKRVALNIELGKLGDPDGYYSAATIEKENAKKLEYLNLAAEQNMLYAYRKMGEIYLNLGEREKFIEISIKAAEKGDLESYNILGQYLHSQKEQSQFYLKQAEIPTSFFDNLKELANIRINKYDGKDYVCPICNKKCSAGDYCEMKDCDICEKHVCMDCIAMAGCQTTQGICNICFEYKCDYCGGKAPKEFYLDEDGCFCKQHRFKHDSQGYVIIKFVKRSII